MENSIIINAASEKIDLILNYFSHVAMKWYD